MLRSFPVCQHRDTHAGREKFILYYVFFSLSNGGAVVAATFPPFFQGQLEGGDRVFFSSGNLVNIDFFPIAICVKQHKKLGPPFQQQLRRCRHQDQTIKSVYNLYPRI